MIIMSVDYIKDVLKIVADNIKCIVTGNYIEGDIDLNTLGNFALTRLDRCIVTPSLKNMPQLSLEQKRAIKMFYRPYVRFMNDRSHRYYTHISGGHFYPEYISEELFFNFIDRYFCNRDEARFLDNKCYYYKLFSGIKQPELVCMRIGQTWLNGNLSPISKNSVLDLLKIEEEVVVKKAVNSEGGFGVYFLTGDICRKFKTLIKDISCDVVIQRSVKQHPMLSELHSSSVNTMRIVTLMTEEKVKVYAATIKIGTGGRRLDNGCQGGIYCGINSDGTLKKRGLLDNGTSVEIHPELGYRFEDKKIPHFEKALQLCKKAHGFMGHFRLISWDVAIDEKGEAVLIEANLSLGGINDIQATCGPLFGKDTKKILDEVFKNNRKVTTWL